MEPILALSSSQGAGTFRSVVVRSSLLRSSLRTCVYCIWRTLGYTISAALNRRLGYGEHGER